MFPCAFSNWRRRYFALLTAALSYTPCAVFGSPPASPFYLSANGIGALSPVQPLPVPPPSVTRAQAVPLDATPCDEQDSALVVPGTGASLTGHDNTATTPCGSNSPPTTVADPDSQALTLQHSDVPRIPVVVISGVSSAPVRWFSAVRSQGDLRYGNRSWTYLGLQGPTFTVGNINANAPSWGNSAALGGLQISNWSGSRSTLPAGQWGYSSSLGRLNHMSPDATAGAVNYGDAVGNGALRYGLTSALTVEGQIQSAPTLTTRGVGTTYASGGYGTFKAGATQSVFDAVNAWRYRFSYSADILDNFALGYTNEQTESGFNDLNHYTADTLNTPHTRNILSADLKLGRWGTLTGTYATLRESQAAATQQVGLTQSLFITPSVKLALMANRDLLSGSYIWRANLSLPVDTLMRNTWLSW